MKVGEALCSDPRRSLQAPACSFSSFGGGNGPKGALNGESSSKGELGFQEQFWQSEDACDCGCEMRGLHHLFIVFKWWSVGPWFWKPCGLGQFV